VPAEIRCLFAISTTPWRLTDLLAGKVKDLPQHPRPCGGSTTTISSRGEVLQIVLMPGGPRRRLLRMTLQEGPLIADCQRLGSERPAASLCEIEYQLSPHSAGNVVPGSPAGKRILLAVSKAISLKPNCELSRSLRMASRTSPVLVNQECHPDAHLESAAASSGRVSRRRYTRAAPAPSLPGPGKG